MYIMRNILIILIVFLGVFQLKAQTNIAGYQYWFDDDYSNCITIPVTSATQLIVNEDVPTTGLSAGIHSFYFRSFDENGLFSGIQSSFFYKNLVHATAVDRKITAYEYWFDEDFDNTVTQPVASQKDMNLITDIPASSVSEGIHTFNIRFQDDSGMWSSSQSRFFYKNFVRAGAVDRKIIAYRYWIDNRFGNVITETLGTPVKSLNLVADLDFTDIEKGEHILHFQYQDDDKMWSTITADTIEKISLPVAGFYYSLQSNCDSVVASFTNSSIDEDTYLWNFGDGATSTFESPTHVYYSSGTYTVVLTVTDTITGQDSSKTEFVDVVITTITSEINPTVCDSYTSPSGKYVWNNSGTYTDTVPASSGCDSVITINLTVIESTSATLTETACDMYRSPSGKYLWTSSGIYHDTIPNSAGCDSVITVNLTVNESTYETRTETACDSYIPPSGNHIWTTSGSYLDTIPNLAGCDSVISIELTIIESTSDTISATACDSYTSPSGNYTWTASGTYQDRITNTAGCDSIITINLTIIESTGTVISATVCDSYTSPSGNYTWTSSGVYHDTIPNSAGCDSIIIIELIVNESTYETRTETACDSYTSSSGNHIWTTSGSYHDTIPNLAGCDSVISIELTIIKSTSATISATACDSYTSPSGDYTWTTSGTYQDRVTNTAGCDSIITINLTIVESTNATISETACDSYISPSGDYTWTTSGIYQDRITNAAGCDSLITINLTVIESTSAVISATACDSYTSPSGNNTWTSSGVYHDTIPNSAGCDSVITINLTVNYSSDSEISLVINEDELPYVWGVQTLTEAGEYTQVFQSLNGCDSTVTLTLIAGDIIPPEVRCNSIDIVLNSDGRYALNQKDIAQLSSGSTDNITTATDLLVSAFPRAFGCDDVGQMAIEVFVTDEAGNESERCWVYCNVIDTAALTVNHVENVEIEIAPGVCEISVEYPEIATTNACAKVEQIEGLGPDGLFPLGTTVEKWIVTNTSGDTLKVSFNVTISTGNDLPTISALSDILVDEDSGPVTVSLNGISFGSDCMEQGITVTAVSDNSALLSNVSVDYTDGDSFGSLELTILPEMSGVAKVTVTVADSEGATVSESFNVTVAPVNDPPFSVTYLASQSMTADSVLNVVVSSVLGKLFDDIDDASLAITITKDDGTALPGWMTFTDDILTFAPTNADTGCVNITVTATDGAGEKADFTFRLCVKGNLTGIGDVEDGTFSVSMFPNPTKGEVTLKINSSVINDSEVIVRSITGSEIFKKKYKATGLIKLDLSNQVSGVYLISLKQGDKFIIEKLILDRK